MTLAEVELWGCFSRPWFVLELTMAEIAVNLDRQALLRFNIIG
jgi:hypothetical protein